MVEIISTAKARGQVEKWLRELETLMKKSVHRKIKECIDDYPKQIRHKWVLVWPGQCVRLLYNFFWTTKITFFFLGAKYFNDVLDVRDNRVFFL